MAKIDEIVEILKKEITTLKAKNHILVAQRIDDNIAFLESLLEEIEAPATKYDLVVNAGAHTTVSITKNGSPVTAGKNVLTDGDTITVVATPAGGYKLDKFTINGVRADSGDTVVVHSNVVVEVSAIAVYDLAVTTSNATVSVTSGGEAVSAGEGVLTSGETIVISAVANEGYRITSLQVNGEDFVSGNSLVVSADVSVVCSTIALFDLSVSATNTTVVVTKGGEPVSAGTDVFEQGDIITITATADADYTLETLTVNGNSFTSGDTLEVSSDVVIVASSNENAPL